MKDEPEGMERVDCVVPEIVGTAMHRIALSTG
jgi:hypothetical protein